MKKKLVKKQKKAEKKESEISSIEFCKKCGNILVPEKKGKNVILKCRKCSFKVQKVIKSIKIVDEKSYEKRDVIVLEKNTTLLPITDKLCEKCNNKKAYYWLQQTRSADEPPTQFFRCTQCHDVCREYK